MFLKIDRYTSQPDTSNDQRLPVFVVSVKTDTPTKGNSKYNANRIAGARDEIEDI